MVSINIPAAHVGRVEQQCWVMIPRMCFKSGSEMCSTSCHSCLHTSLFTSSSTLVSSSYFSLPNLCWLCPSSAAWHTMKPFPLSHSSLCFSPPKRHCWVITTTVKSSKADCVTGVSFLNTGNEAAQTSKHVAWFQSTHLGLPYKILF